MVVYTTNGGLNWMTSNSGISLLWHFYFINTNVGWAVGTPSDSVAKTIDGGVNWYRVPTSIAGKPFKSNFFVNDSVGWIVGYDGIILKTTSGGEILTNVYYDSDIPEYFSLYQNYPNPFNPTTTIKYQLGNDGYVSLKVFNTLGEEVAELVNEFKRAGSYDLTFNAENLPSGMYVYKLTSGNYVESKKMIMMK